MASMAHRISARLAWGCALLLAISVSGCAASPDTGVSDPAGHVHFTVPGGWRPIGASALAAELKSTIGGLGNAWGCRRWRGRRLGSSLPQRVIGLLVDKRRMGG